MDGALTSRQTGTELSNNAPLSVQRLKVRGAFMQITAAKCVKKTTG